MARMMHRELEKWFKEEKREPGIFGSRQCRIEMTGERFQVSLRGAAKSGRIVTTYTEMDAKESGISGGGSAPDGWEMAVRNWREQAETL